MYKFKKHERAVKYAVDILKNSEINNIIEDVILYGSCARGDEKISSDIDLLIVISDNVNFDISFNKLFHNIKVNLEEDLYEAAEVDAKFTEIQSRKPPLPQCAEECNI